MHMCSHTTLPGPLVEGNRRADILAGITVVTSTFEQTHLSHAFYHANAKALQKTFHLTMDQAREIVTACPDCQLTTPSLSYGVNPRGLQALEIWQTDVTHIPEFGKLKYVYVLVDTFSSTIIATAHTGEKTKDVCRRFLLAFATLGVPKQIKPIMDLPMYHRRHKIFYSYEAFSM